MSEDKLISLISELQALSQAGIYYAKDPFDKERYERLREISAEMMALKTDTSIKDIKELFCSDYGYQTPKIDTRSAVFKDDKILLVQERDGKWSLPGGWCEVKLAPDENAVKECREEAGRNVKVKSVIAVQNRDYHLAPQYVYGVVAIFYLCEEFGGEFEQNIETLGADYFDIDNLPTLEERKTSKEQISMCFDSYHSENWQTRFD